MILLHLMMVCLFPLSAKAADTYAITGPARVLDGDTLRINGMKIRLWGIDAAELDQTCVHQAQPLPCGRMAQAQLEDMLNGRNVTCTPKGSSYDRVVAQCFMDGQDVGAMLMRAGLAFEVLRYSKGFYSAEQNAARADAVGLWAMDVAENPYQWRKRHKM